MGPFFSHKLQLVRIYLLFASRSVHVVAFTELTDSFFSVNTFFSYELMTSHWVDRI